MEDVPDFGSQRKALSDATAIFLRHNFTHSSKSIKVLMDHDFLVVRVDHFLSPAEIKMGKEKSSTYLIHEMYSKLFDRVKSSLVDRIETITRKKVKSSQININLENELCVMVFFLEPKLNGEKMRLTLLVAPQEKE